MLVGREAAVEQLRARVAERGAVVLTGPAGIGKTTVARVALEDVDPWTEAGALATLAWAPLLVFRRLLAADVAGDAESVAAAVLRRGFDAILLDDLQWADAASLDVVAHLIDRMAVVATVRTGEERSTLVIESLALVGAELIEVGPLEGSDARRLVTRLHPRLASSERDLVLRRAGGNPLLLAELPSGSAGSSTLVSALLARLGRLDAVSRRAAQRLAVLGRPADPALLGTGAAAIVAAGLADEVDGLTVMRHALLSEVIVDLLGDEVDDVRRTLSAQVVGSEAAHLLAAAGERDAARQMALRAAGTADDPSQRAALLELAIACAPEGEPDVENRLIAARLFVDLSQPERAAALCRPGASESLSRAERGALLSIAGLAAWLQDRPADSQELIEKALRDLRGTDSPEEVHALAASTIVDTRLSMDGRPALQRARKAVELADRVGAYQNFAGLRLASVLVTAGEPGWAELYEQVMDNARREGDETGRRLALTSLVLAHWTVGDPELGHRLAWEDVQIGPAHDHDALWLANHAYAAVIGLLVGVDQQLLLDRHQEVLDAEPVFRNRQFLEAAVGLALVDLGRFTDADRRSHEAVRRAGLNPQARSVAWWLVAETAWLGGRRDDAVNAAQEVRALPVGDYPSAVHARLLGGHAQREAGEGMLPGPEPVALLPAWTAAPIEWTALAASLAGRHQDAVADFDRAGDAWRGHDVRSEVRCRWAAADEARRVGADDAVDRLLRAVELAEDRRLGPVASRGRQSLRAMGVASRTPSAPGREGLTAREEQVLSLVGAGRSSPEIADALGIKASTVESFVRSAVRKLGATSRLAAAASLRGDDHRSS